MKTTRILFLLSFLFIGLKSKAQDWETNITFNQGKHYLMC